MYFYNSKRWSGINRHHKFLFFKDFSLNQGFIPILFLSGGEVQHIQYNNDEIQSVNKVFFTFTFLIQSDLTVTPPSSLTIHPNKRFQPELGEFPVGQMLSV